MNRRGHKAINSRNPLSRPQTPIHALAVRFQEHLHFPDPTPLYALMGAVAGNCLTGNPIWLMLVGPPSCGKTELLGSLLEMDKVIEIGSLRGPAALLSASGKKDISKSSTGGILRQLGDRGALVLKDFTSILSLPHDPLGEVLSAFRELYDGRWSRQVGTDGGQQLSWEGRLALFGGVTPTAIDQHHQATNEMGERWIFYRYEDTGGFGECNRALDVTDPQESRLELRGVVKGFFDGLGLSWWGSKKRTITLAEKGRIISIATLTAKARSSVRRNNWNKEVEDVPQSEGPARLSTVLGQLYLGLEAIGLPDNERWLVITRIAMDCMPQVRRRVVDLVTRQYLNGAGVIADFDSISGVLMCSTSTVRRTIEDLELHGVIEKSGKKWDLTRWARGEWNRGWR